MTRVARDRLIVGLGLALLALAAPSASTAQDPVVIERVVSLAPEGGIDVLGVALRNELGLFPEVQGFVSATLLEREGRAGWTLEIVRRAGEGVVRERRPLDADGLAALRARVAEAFSARGMSRAVDRDGRGGVVLASTLLGLGYYGWAVPAAFDIDNERAALAAYLLTSGASFLLPYLATRNHPVSRAERDATVWGATRGIIVGSVLGDLFSLDAEFDEDRERARLGVGVLGSVGLGLAGYAWAGRTEADIGRAALAGALGDFALAGGFTSAYAMGLYDGETHCEGDVCFTQDTESTRAGHAVGLGLGLAGTIAAARHARGRDIGQGDVRMIQSGGLLGAQVMAPIGRWVLDTDHPDHERLYAGLLVAGAGAGLWAGNRYGTHGRLTPGDGLLVLAGHLAGGAGAAGLTYLLDDDDGSRNASLYLTTSAIGSLVGSILTYRAVRGGAPSPESAGAASVELNPLALMGSIGGAGAPAASPPAWLTIRF